MRKKILVSSIAVIVVALIGAGVWWLFSTGRLVYVDSNTKARVSSSVCDSTIVDRYNAAMYYEVRNNSTTPSIDEDGIKALVADIKGKSGYETDPTCQVIIFWAAVRGDDYKAARSAYDSIKTLHDKGSFADSNIRSNEPLFTYEGYVNGLTGSGAPQDNGVAE